MEQEVWKPVVGLEDRYEVSNFGRVRSVDRDILKSDGKVQHKKGVVLKQFITNKGYPYVMVNKDCKQHLKTVHRLVAQAFIPNPNNYPIVNHKDEDKTNNCVENLEWCTSSYNSTYNGVNKRVSAKLKGRPANNRIPVVDETTGVVYNSCIEASRKLHINGSLIRDMRDGRLDSVNGIKIRKYKEPSSNGRRQDF